MAFARVLLHVVLVLVVSACTNEPASGPRPGTAAPRPSSPAPTAVVRSTPASPTPSPQRGSDRVAAYFVREAPGGRHFVEPETHELQAPTVGVAGAAMRELVAGDTIDPKLSSLAPPGTRVRAVDIDGDVLTVDLSGEVRNRPGLGLEETFAQQLAWTGAQFPGVDAVRLWVDGGPVSDLWGEVDWSQPVAPDPFALSPIVIDAPQWGEVVSGPVAVTGTANVFEATVELRLLDEDGRVAADTFTTATCGTGCRGEFTHAFGPLPAGRWTIEAHEPDPSGGEGHPPFVTRVEFTTRG